MDDRKNMPTTNSRVVGVLRFLAQEIESGKYAVDLIRTQHSLETEYGARAWLDMDKPHTRVYLTLELAATETETKPHGRKKTAKILRAR